MPEGFNSIGDLKVVVDANTDKLSGGLELAQGLISRFQTDANEKLSGFDRIVQLAGNAAELFKGRLGLVSAALGVAGLAIDQFKEYGKKFAAETGTEEQFENLVKAVDGVQDAIVGGLYNALDGAQTKVTALALSLVSTGSSMDANAAQAGNLAGVIQEELTKALGDIEFALRRLQPASQKTFEQLTKEVEFYTAELKRGRDLIPDTSVEDAFLPGIPDSQKLGQQQEYIKGLELSLLLAQQFASIQKIGEDYDARVKQEQEAQSAVEKTLEQLDREIASLETKAATLGMTSAATAEYIARQRVSAVLSEHEVEITEGVNQALAERAAKYRELYGAIDAFNKGERDRQQAEQQDRQVGRILQSLDDEVSAQRRKAAAYGLTSAEAVALERAERALSAIRAAGREPNAQEIRHIMATTEALREQIQETENVKRAYDQMRQYVQSVTSGLESAFRRWTQTGKIEVKDMVQSILADLAQLTFKQGISGLGGLLSNALGSAFSSGSGLPSIQAFADGGRPPLDIPSLVGERGPELFIPDQAGTVIPNAILEALTRNPAQQQQQQTPSDSRQVALSVNIDARNSTPDSVARLEAELPQRINDIVRDLRDRGAL